MIGLRLLALSDQNILLLGFLTAAVSAVGAYFTARAQHRGAVETVDRQAANVDQTANAFIAVIVDTQKRLARAEKAALTATEDARAARQAEKECKAEAVRLQGLVQAILDREKENGGPQTRTPT